MGKFPLNDDFDLVRPVEMIARATLLGSHDVPALGRVDVGRDSSYLLAIHDSQVVGYAKFASTPYLCRYSYLREVMHGTYELGFLKVEPENFGHGIGALLLEHAKSVARGYGHQLLVRPQRPGEKLYDEERNCRFPLSDEQLRGYYLRHGFRELSEKETKSAVIMLDASDIFGSLLRPKIEYPPLPEPVFSNTLADKVLRYVRDKPFFRSNRRVCQAVQKRRPMEEYIGKIEEELNNLYKKSHNYPYVRQHLIQA